MGLGTKLSLAFAGMIAAAGLAGWRVHSSSQQAFDQVDQQRTKTVLAQLHQLLAASKAEVHQQIDQAANSEAIRRMLVSPVASALPLEGLVEEVRRQGKETSQTIVWSRRSADAKFDDVLIYLFGPIDPRRGSIWSFCILI